MFPARDHFRDAQVDDSRVGSDFSELRCELEPSGVRELEAELVGGDDRDADRRGFEDGLEPYAGIDLASRQILGSSMSFLRNARQLMDVDRGPEPLGHRLHEFQIFGVEVARVVVARHHDRADRLAVRLDRTGDQTLLGHGSDHFLFGVVAAKVDDGIALHVREEERTPDLEHGARNSLARAVGRAIDVLAVARDGRIPRCHSAHAQLARARGVHVDHRRPADRFRDAASGFIQVLERGLDRHRRQTDVREALGMTAPPRLALAIDAIIGNLLSDVLDENGDALGRARETSADRRDDPIDISPARSHGNLEILVEVRLAGFCDMPYDDIETGNDFVNA